MGEGIPTKAKMAPLCDTSNTQEITRGCPPPPPPDGWNRLTVMQQQGGEYCPPPCCQRGCSGRGARPWIAINEKGTRSGSLSLQSRSCSADYAWGAFFVAFQAALQDFLKSWRAFRSLGNSSLAASLQGVPAAACEPPWP